MKTKFRFFGKVTDGEMRMVMAEAIDFTTGFVYYSYHDYTVEGDDNVYGDTISFEDCVIMQSTGLKDKNSKEIFEGDVVKYKGGWKTFTEEVAYNENFGGFGVVDADADIIFAFGELFEHINLNSLEVIGNVYENPELLGGDICVNGRIS